MRINISIENCDFTDEEVTFLKHAIIDNPKLSLVLSSDGKVFSKTFDCLLENLNIENQAFRKFDLLGQHLTLGFFVKND